LSQENLLENPQVKKIRERNNKKKRICFNGKYIKDIKKWWHHFELEDGFEKVEKKRNRV